MRECLGADARELEHHIAATTVYLLVHEMQRLRWLAVDQNVSMHDLLLRGLDRLLAEAGQRPLQRYTQVVPSKAGG